MLLVASILSVSILLVIILYSLFWYHPKKLSKSQKAYYRGMLTSALSRDHHSALVRCDTVLEHIMQDLGNQGTMSEMLQKRKNYKHVEHFWRYHKLRNKVVHEMHPPKITLEDVEDFKKKIEEQFLN